MEAIVEALERIRSGLGILDENLRASTSECALVHHSIPNLARRNARDTHDWSIECDESTLVRGLLISLFADAIDFAFIPAPKPFVIFADHDEYTTFFSPTKSNLNRAVREMSQRSMVARDYHRHL